MEQSKPFVHIKKDIYTIWKVTFLALSIFRLALLFFFYNQLLILPVSHTGVLEQGWFVQLFSGRQQIFQKPDFLKH